MNPNLNQLQSVTYCSKSQNWVALRHGQGLQRLTTSEDISLLDVSSGMRLMLSRGRKETGLEKVIKVPRKLEGVTTRLFCSILWRVSVRRDNEQRLFDMGSYLKLKCDNIFCRQVLVLMGDTALSTECNNPKDCRMSFDATIFLDSAFDRLWVSTE
ncbi:uncharacterized protein [Physcomitrium patens]|uniref:uncharacterized protein n=1 Tax=Physcomitrium patens TaxID=3218 RepID=UPI003CCE1ECB